MGSKIRNLLTYYVSPAAVLVVWVLSATLSCQYYSHVLPSLSPVENEWDSLWRDPIRFSHGLLFAFLLFNTLFNYVMTISTPNDCSNKDYHAVIGALAVATTYKYPDTPTKHNQARQEAQRKRNVRHHCQWLPPWMEMTPTEWSFCLKSDQPKPPRSHYDGTSQTLALNFDHYCPWCFNTIGYFNYRYFLNFQLFGVGIHLYNVACSARPVVAMIGALLELKNANSVRDWIPPRESQAPIVFFFAMSAILLSFQLVLLVFHTKLVLSARTTVEFSGYKRKMRLERWWKQQSRNQEHAPEGMSIDPAWAPSTSPYDLGWKRNFQQVYGTGHPLLAFLPSLRLPEFLPVPMEVCKRHVSHTIPAFSPN